MSSVQRFQTVAHGKWILLGEHSVLRGCSALAFPVYGKSLSLQWESSGPATPFRAVFRGERGPEFQLLFSGVFDRALEILGEAQSSTLKNGTFTVESTLPVGAGLGASAALSVAVGRWFVHMKALDEARLFEFCRELENLFHGESSGVDVAVALGTGGASGSSGLKFKRSMEAAGPALMKTFECAWSPIWYISFSGARGITSECVSKVKTWMRENPEQGIAMDRMMVEAVAIAERALTSPRSDESFQRLVQSIQMGAECFETWGLSGGELGRHMMWLRESGASAVKPTGSGGGGFALSLWRQRPPTEIENHLVPVFR